jgi:hypothetical protein
MNPHDEFDRSLARWLRAEAPPAASAEVLDRILLTTRARRPRPRLLAAIGSRQVVAPPAGGPLWRTDLRPSVVLAILLLALGLLGGALIVGARLLEPAPVEPPISESGEVVFSFKSWGPEPDSAEVVVTADGRVIWKTDEEVGFVQQRLSAEGVERIRSRLLSAGLFGGDLALVIDGIDAGHVTVDDGGRAVTAVWNSSPVTVSDVRVNARFAPATPAQAAAVSELRALLSDPTAWELPDGDYIQRDVTPFVPSHLSVGYDRARPVLTDLPSPAREILTRALQRPAPPDCGHITIAKAEEIARALAAAGVRVEPAHRVGVGREFLLSELRYGFAFFDPSSSSLVHVDPVLPPDRVGCTGG